MEPEDKRMLKRVLELSLSNHKMIKSLHGALVWNRVSSVVYWLFIIGVSIGLYYYLQPILDSFLKTYQDVTGQAIDFKNSFDALLQKR